MPQEQHEEWTNDSSDTEDPVLRTMKAEVEVCIDFITFPSSEELCSYLWLHNGHIHLTFMVPHIFQDSPDVVILADQPGSSKHTQSVHPKVRDSYLEKYLWG